MWKRKVLIMCKTVLSEVKEDGNKDNQAETGQLCPNKIGSVVHAKVQNILFENAQPVFVKPAEIVDTTHGTRTVQNTNDYMDLITF